MLTSGWGLTQPSEEKSFLEGKGQAVELQFVWLEVMSLSDCSDMVNRVKKSEECKREWTGDGTATSNVTLCVLTTGNPKKGVESGELLAILHTAVAYPLKTTEIFPH